MNILSIRVWALASAFWFRCASCSPPSGEYGPCHNNALQRIIQVIDILSHDSITLNSGSTTRMLEAHTEAVDILQMLQEDLSQHKQRRFLENEDEREIDDDYFSSIYFRDGKNSEVSVSYDDEDNTVVTVGDDVIVYVEHEWDFYVYNISMVVLCIVIGATMAGLLMGIMSLDPLIVGVKARTAVSDQERQQAMTLLPFVQNKNLVLVSLLLVNCGTNEALPIFLDALLENPLLTVILSLTVVLMVGEILPSAYFTGRDQIRSACQLVGVLRFVIVLTSPISYPLSQLMDHYFREGTSALKRGELAAMVRIQYEEQLASRRMDREISNVSGVSTTSFLKTSVSSRDLHSLFPEERPPFSSTPPSMELVPSHSLLQQVYSMNTSFIGRDDVIRLEGALTMKDKKVQQIYTPLHQVITIMGNAILDKDMIAHIYSYGYSRIPVLRHIEGDLKNGALGVCGILLTKQLMLIGKDDGRRVMSLPLYEPPCISPDTSLAEALNILLTGPRQASLMAWVCWYPEIAAEALRRKEAVPQAAGVIGMFTLEDLFEALIQEPIYDEKDKRIFHTERIPRRVLAQWKAFVAERRRRRECNNDAALMTSQLPHHPTFHSNEMV